MCKVRRVLIAPNQTDLVRGPMAPCPRTASWLLGLSCSLLLALVLRSSGQLEAPSSEFVVQGTGRSSVFLLPFLKLFPSHVLGVAINVGTLKSDDGLQHFPVPN